MLQYLIFLNYVPEKVKFMSITFSLIIATINRYKELKELLYSLSGQNLARSEFEVIIVDQNPAGFLGPLIEQFSSILKVKYIHSDLPGSSVNRNIGIHNADGKIICFPDDDCTYYPDTLTSVKRYFISNPNVDCVLGQVVDSKNNKLIRNWPDKKRVINKQNFLRLYTQITVFTKLKDICFDKDLGVGVRYGAYEDADYIYQLLKVSNQFTYTPTIKVWHPELNLDVMALGKIKSYSMGFGAFCRKNLSFGIIFLFAKVMGFHFLKFITGAVSLDIKEIKKRFFSMKYRLMGFFEYS